MFLRIESSCPVGFRILSREAVNERNERIYKRIFQFHVHHATKSSLLEDQGELTALTSGSGHLPALYYSKEGYDEFKARLVDITNAHTNWPGLLTLWLKVIVVLDVKR